jgi:hypothetical protein
MRGGGSAKRRPAADRARAGPRRGEGKQLYEQRVHFVKYFVDKDC